jgi:uncharacterized protein
VSNVDKSSNSASSRGIHFNTGNGPTIQPVDIGHSEYIALLDPDTAFWSLIKKDKLGEALTNGSFMEQYREKVASFSDEMQALRFGLVPSAVYFNPTERCNLNCDYCYIPETIRKNGQHTSEEELIKALDILETYFQGTVTDGRRPQIVFHGSEPMMNRKAVFAAIEKYKDVFLFGVQTNGTLLDDEAVEFLTERGISIGLSLDGHIGQIADSTRKNWNGEGVSEKVISIIKKLKKYQNYSVICTVTQQNMAVLSEIVNYFHSLEIPCCMLNPVRCTLQGGRNLKPQDHEMVGHYLEALDRNYELGQKTGRKMVIANFANVLVSIVAPTARRLMCDISPCGGGRCFFAVSARGDLFPCSEFIGIPEFCGGNLFKGEIKQALSSPAFKKVTGRIVEAIEPCSRCAVRHFCGSPCPAEAHEMNGRMDRPGAFCELYEEQVRYALRIIADGKEDAYLWDHWDSDTTTSINITAL